MRTSFNVVIATAGRPTLQHMVDSIAPQLEEQDYLTIIWDCQPIDLQIDSKCQVMHLQNPEPLGYWGHGSRNRWQDELPGDFFMNADDDDEYTPDAMEAIRSAVKENKLYIFKFHHHGAFVPRENRVYVGNVGTSCGVYPKIDKFPKWEYVYGGDGMFYESLSKELPVEFVDHVIYNVRPHVSFDTTEPEKPVDQIICCGFDCYMTYNKMLRIWEGYCSRCGRTAR